MSQSVHKRYNAESKNVLSIQKYTGKDYRLYDNNEKIFDIAKEHSEEINDTVRAFFWKAYSTNVKVNNIVSAKDSVTVFVKSVNEPCFHTYAVLPIHEKEKKIMWNRIWSQEGEVERAIKSGLYVMAFDIEFNMLDEYLESATRNFPIIGTPEQVIDMTKANGYTTPYYFISPSGSVFEKAFTKFRRNPKIRGQELRTFFQENLPCPKGVNIGIEFYMKEKDAAPEQDILDAIVLDIENMVGIPRGAYSFYLNDNFIDIYRGVGKKDNTLTKKSPYKLLKE